MNTKPTFDPSPLMRLPGSTRRSCAVQARVAHTGTNPSLSVAPLNNGSPDIKSWGTICFPQKGRIYLEDGASAEYNEKNGAGFFFINSGTPIPDRRFLDAAGTAYSSFHDWCNATGVIEASASTGTFTTSVYVLNDGDFDNDSLSQDGSTVNDRLFQSLDDVTHDYQLGTQYASTRAMVEIPVFPQQFFDHTELGIFPGPDNSMKLHIDATYTAHTWNPTPVGRRADDIGVADKSSNSAYSYTINNRDYIESATILRVVKNTNDVHVYVSHPKMFPPAPAVDEVGNLIGIHRVRRVFLANGEWAVYDNDPPSNGYLTIPLNVTGGYVDGHSETFFQNAIVGAKLHIGGGFRNETLIPVASDLGLPSSDLEARSPYYYDMANMKTQGGNLDYGLRQYVSAVEFKAGPLANPHAARTVTKRATSTITQAIANTTSNQYTLTLEDASLFPDVETNTVGDLLYVGEVMLDTPVEVAYFGNDAGTSANTVIVETLNGASITLSDFIGAEFRLKKAGHNMGILSDPSNITSTEGVVSTSVGETSTERWEAKASASAGSTTSIQIGLISGTNRFAHANSVGFNVRKGDRLFKQGGDYIGEVSAVVSNLTGGTTNTVVTLTANNVSALSIGDDIYVSAATVIQEDFDAILNRSWLYPYAQGGLRNGDTVWMNMSINNPHAVEGLFAKSVVCLTRLPYGKASMAGRVVLTTTHETPFPLKTS